MKVVIVNESDESGGAARAAYRLHRALLHAHIESRMIVQTKASNDSTVINASPLLERIKPGLRRQLDSVPVRRYLDRQKVLFSSNWLASSSLIRQINACNPDIVHLHWISHGMLRIEDLRKIRAPIVWSLHDMWAFTGGCHYTQGCNHYLTQCGSCPTLGSKATEDLSAYHWARKQRAYRDLPSLVIIGLSQWMTDRAASSGLLHDKPTCTLPNPIDTNVFSPLDRAFARQMFNLPPDKKLILFGAMDATRDPRKGFHILTEALKHLSNSCHLVIYGADREESCVDLTHATSYAGVIHDDAQMRALYCCADVVVVPSRQENLSNTIMESLACGTPVVAFDIGGNSDLISHKSNGYLASPFDATDLAQGITWVMDHPDPSQLHAAARSKAVDTFDQDVVVSQYLELYNSVLRHANISYQADMA